MCVYVRRPPAANVTPSSVKYRLSVLHHRSISIQKTASVKGMESLQGELTCNLLSANVPHDFFAHRCLFVTFSVAFILRTRLTILNRHKDVQLALLSEQEKDTKDEKELADSDPRFRYMT